MGSSAPAAPTPPDPVATASAQGASNVSTASAQTQLNNTNQFTPYGSVQYFPTGESSVKNPDGTYSEFPTWSSVQTLSPSQQKLFNQQNALGTQANNAASLALGTLNQDFKSPVTNANLPGLTTSLSTPSLATGYDQGGAIQTGYSTGPALQYGYDPGGTIQSDVKLNTNAPTTFGNTAGQIQYGLGNTDFSAETNNATNAVLARLQPTMDRGNSSLQAQLANQGITQGSAAYNSAMLQNAQQNNDLSLGAVATGDQEQQALFGEAATANQLYNAAQQQDYGQQLGRGQFAQQGIAQNNAATLDMGQFHNAAQLQQNGENAAAAGFYNQTVGQQNAQNAALAAFGNQAQAQQNSENQQSAAFGNSALQGMFGMNQAAGTFGNQAREQSLTDQETIANNSVNQISALMHGGQVTTGQYQGYTPGQIGQTPISADTYASANLAEQNYQTESQAAAANNAMWGQVAGGLFGMGGKAIGQGGIWGSDRRIKRDITPLGTAPNGLPLYSYRYVWDDDDTPLRTGHMAQEVMLVRPDAVYRMPAGYLAVDYGAL